MTDSVAVRFASVKRTQPEPLAATWPELVAALSEHAERAEKLAGALWSPVTYCDGARRSLAGVDRVHAFVADLDGHDLDAVRPHLDGLAFVAYTLHPTINPPWGSPTTPKASQIALSVSSSPQVPPCSMLRR